MSWCQLTARSASWIGVGVSGKSGSSCVYTVTAVAAASSRSTDFTEWHVAHSSLTTTTMPSGSTGAVVEAGMTRTYQPARRPRPTGRHAHAATNVTSLGLRKRSPDDLSCVHRGFTEHRDRGGRYGADVSRRPRFDAVPRRRDRSVRRQHVVRVARGARSRPDPVRPRHRAALLRADAAGRPAVPGHLPAQPPALGPHPGPARSSSRSCGPAPTSRSTPRSSRATSPSATSSPTRSNRRCSRSTSRCSRAWSTSTRSATASSRSVTTSG